MTPAIAGVAVLATIAGLDLGDPVLAALPSLVAGFSLVLELAISG